MAVTRIRLHLASVFALLMAAMLMAATLASPACADGLETLQIITASGTHDFQVEVAKDEESRARGLMNRPFMPADRGMLFEFERDEPVAFWMKNTYIPLDMIFISSKGRVTNVVANAEPLSERILPSGPPCVAVLELNGGAAASIGLKVGDAIRHPFFRP
jgi:uncharacterized membrane protein (UPF0127 family)